MCALEPGEVAVELTGPIITSAAMAEVDQRYCLQIGADTFQAKALIPDAVGDLVNHSCDPNCVVVLDGERVILWVIRSILPGDEVSYDYGLTATPEHTDDTVCLCHSSKCRGVIGHFAALPLEAQEWYTRRGFVPEYVHRGVAQW